MLRKRALLFVTVAALLALPQVGSAISTYSMVEYYSDAAFTNWVGYKYRLCTSLQQGGQVGAYAEVIAAGSCYEDTEGPVESCTCKESGVQVVCPPSITCS